MVYASTYPTQSLRGLGALSAQEAASLPPLEAQVRAGLTDLVNFSRSKTSEIVASYKGSFTRFARFIQDELLPGQTVGKTPADEWAANIVGYAENVRAILSRPDAAGTPFFMRLPQDAKRLVETAKIDLANLIKELDDQVKALSFASIVQSIVNGIVVTLAQVAEILVKSGANALVSFPVGSVAIAVVAATVVWYKFLRR